MGEKMPIERTEFGSVTIDGNTYKHDVIIGLSGEIKKRKKKLSKEKYGTSHIISKKEAKFIFEDGCDLLIIGTGQQGNVRLLVGPTKRTPQADSNGHLRPINWPPSDPLARHRRMGHSLPSGMNSNVSSIGRSTDKFVG
jgi:hypothetical protein